jgi:hypothetical protein
MPTNSIFQSLSNYFLNPTKTWPERGRQDLVYDLRTQAVNGMRLTARLEEASRFGKCDFIHWVWWKAGRFFYNDSGLILSFANGELTAVTAVFDTDFFSKKKLSPANLTVIDLSGQPHELRGHSTLDDLKRCFGEPQDSEEIDERTIDYDFWAGKNYVFTNLDRNSGRLLNVEIAELVDAEAPAQK